MDIRVMRYFLAIAQEENLTKAANMIHISQPSLSRQMKELEEELGKVLFIRGNRKITLTEDGMYFRKRAQEIVNLTDKLLVDLDMDEYDLSGDIHIGCGETTGMAVITEAIAQMHEKYPDVCFHTHSGNAFDIQEQIEKGLLDLGLFVGENDFSKFEVLKLKQTNQWGLVCKKEDPLAQKEFVRKEDIMDLPLIVSRQALNKNDALIQWLGQDPKIVATYNLFYNAGFLVEQKIGYALTIDGLCESHKDLVFVPLEPRLDVDLYVAWKKYQALSKAVVKFIDFLRESAL